MMKSEFIERTGFEPTADEYREIEAEYMACDVDKDQFCKTWKRNGGIQRLSRLRSARIEELERELTKKDKLYEECETFWSKKMHLRCEQADREADRLDEKFQEADQKVKTLEVKLQEVLAEKKEAEEKLQKISEAFKILGLAQ